jgi:hypothetical protein
MRNALSELAQACVLKDKSWLLVRIFNAEKISGVGLTARHCNNIAIHLGEMNQGFAFLKIN